MQFLGLSVVLFLEWTALSYCPCAGWALEGVGIGALVQIRGCIWDVICVTILLSLLISLGICGSYCISKYIVYNNGSPAKLVSGELGVLRERYHTLGFCFNYSS